MKEKGIFRNTWFGETIKEPFPNRSILIPKNKLHQVPSLASLLTSVQPMTVGQIGEKFAIIDDMNNGQ